MEEKFYFEFNVMELNIMLKALKKLPYEESANIIQKIISVHEQQSIEKEKEKQKVIKKEKMDVKKE